MVKPLYIKSVREAYRADITGLRACAILAVVGFHFSLPGFGGGFVGVDAFFAISGFLMTQIIWQRHEAGAFSIASFYAARVKRIVPAIAVLCLVLLIFGMIALSPLTLKGIAVESLASLLFVSNFLFASQGGYFDAGASAHWLLHTWSLSVEWQFYLLYPVLFIAFRKLKFSKTVILAFLSAITLLSIFIADYIVRLYAHPTQWYYYMLPNRIWEMTAGGVVFILGYQLNIGSSLRRVFHYTGTLGLLMSVFLMSDNTPWPSLASAIPVVSTCLVLASANDRPGWATVLPVERLGRWSYSIYLWHWPLVALVAKWQIELDIWSRISLCGLSVVLGFISYELVEKRLTSLLYTANVRSYVRVSMLAAVSVAAVLLWRTDGAETLRTPDSERLAGLRNIRAAMGDWSYRDGCTGGLIKNSDQEYCYVGRDQNAEVLVIGDSHAQQLIPRYARLLRNSDYESVLFVTHGGCLPIRGTGRGMGYSKCASQTAGAYDLAFTGKYRRVVIVAMWGTYLDPGVNRLRDGLCFVVKGVCSFPKSDGERVRLIATMLGQFRVDVGKLKALGVEVVVSDLAPFGGEADNSKLYDRAFFGGEWLPNPIDRLKFESTWSGLRKPILNAASGGGARIVEPLDWVCSSRECPTHDGNTLLYKDAAHFRNSVVTDKRYGYLDQYLLNPAGELAN